MVPMAKNKRVRGRSDELMSVFFALHSAQVVKTEAVEFGGRFVDGGVVGWREGDRFGGGMDRIRSEGNMGVGGDGVSRRKC